MSNFKENLRFNADDADTKRKAIDQLFDLLNEQYSLVQALEEDSNSRNIKSDIILDLMHFLMDYDKNVKILNEHIYKEKDLDR